MDSTWRAFTIGTWSRANSKRRIIKDFYDLDSDGFDFLLYLGKIHNDSADTGLDMERL